MAVFSYCHLRKPSLHRSRKPTARRWLVTVPLRCEDGHSGRQTFVVSGSDVATAYARARAQSKRPQARRHRRSASTDFSAATIEHWEPEPFHRVS
jgi:hypothetical protein